MCPECYVSMFGKGHRDCPICEELFTRQDLVGLNEIRELCAQPNQKNALEELSSESLKEASMAAQTNMKVLYDAYHQGNVSHPAHRICLIGPLINYEPSD